MTFGIYSTSDRRQRLGGRRKSKTESGRQILAGVRLAQQVTQKPLTSRSKRVWRQRAEYWQIRHGCPQCDPIVRWRPQRFGRPLHASEHAPARSSFTTRCGTRAGCCRCPANRTVHEPTVDEHDGNGRGCRSTHNALLSVPLTASRLGQTIASRVVCGWLLGATRLDFLGSARQPISFAHGSRCETRTPVAGRRAVREATQNQ